MILQFLSGHKKSTKRSPRKVNNVIETQVKDLLKKSDQKLILMARG